jgi:hypothetical protein
MSMIRVVTYKASIQQDGSIYNESVELSAEMDSMPLAQSQLDDAGGRVDQLRQFVLGKRKEWEGAPKASLTGPVAPAPTAPATPAQPKAQATIDGTKPAAAPAAPKGVVKCIKCGTPVEHRENKEKGTKWSFCPTCKDNRREDGTEFPPKGA